MNEIILQGIIKDIRFSHYIGDIEYYQASIIVKRADNKEDIVPIKFKRFCNTYKDGDLVSLIGNVRTYSTRDKDGSNHVQLYVFTYFDKPEAESTNLVHIDGNICKRGELRKTKTGIDVLDFTIANNLKNDQQTFNTYIPIVAWGKDAKVINKLNVGNKIELEGHFSSRAYKKKVSENDFEFKIAYEINMDDIKSYGNT